MKAFYSIVILFSIGLVSNAQENKSPSKDTNTIYVNVSEDKQTVYKNFGRLILDAGYFIEKSDADFLTIETAQTNFKNHPNWSQKWFMKIRFSDGKIIINPFWKANIEMNYGGVKGVDTPYQWKYGKSETDYKHQIYESIMDLLSKYPNSGITYN